MNSFNKTPFKKRSDPFSSNAENNVEQGSRTVLEEKAEVKETLKNPFESSKSKLILEDEIEEKAEVVVKKEEVKQPTIKQVTKPTPKKVVVIDEDDANREKYTATMDKNLRIRVKKAAIDLGLQVSSFIEEACIEKLEREGK